MGGQHSKSKGAAAAAPSPGSPSTSTAQQLSPIWTQRLHLLTDGEDQLTRSHIEQFGAEYGSRLWAYFSPDNAATVSVEEFAAKARPLFGNSTDIYVRIAGDGKTLLQIAGDLVDAAPNEKDELYLNVLEQLASFGGDWNGAVAWKHAEAARAADPLQLRFHAAFSSIPVPSIPSSNLISPFCMFYLRASIPPSYLPPQNHEWTTLYSSVTAGLSVSRFESCVFGYKSRTLAIVRTASGTFAVGVDQEWRHSLTAFGGPDAFCIRLSPAPIVRLTTGGCALHCNLKLRATKMGIWWRGDGGLDLDKDLSQVHEMEVWACGGTKHLDEHAKLKVWQKKQAEKHNKVPLPGNWDDNADKTLLEMAGFQFSNERNKDPRPEERRQ